MTWRAQRLKIVKILATLSMMSVHMMNFQTIIQRTALFTVICHQVFPVVFEPGVFTVRIMDKSHLPFRWIQCIIGDLFIIMIPYIIYFSFICKAVAGILFDMSYVNIHPVFPGNKFIRSFLSSKNRMGVVSGYIQRLSVFQRNPVKRAFTHIAYINYPILDQPFVFIQRESNSIPFVPIFIMQMYMPCHGRIFFVMHDPVHFSDCRLPSSSMNTIDAFLSTYALVKQVRATGFNHLPDFDCILIGTAVFACPFHEFVFHGMNFICFLLWNILD